MCDKDNTAAAGVIKLILKDCLKDQNNSNNLPDKKKIWFTAVHLSDLLSNQNPDKTVRNKYILNV